MERLKIAPSAGYAGVPEGILEELGRGEFYPPEEFVRSFGAPAGITWVRYRYLEVKDVKSVECGEVSLDKDYFAPSKWWAEHVSRA